MRKTITILVISVALALTSLLAADNVSINEWFPTESGYYFTYKATYTSGTNSITFCRKVIVVRNLNDDLDQCIFVYHDEPYYNGSPYFSDEVDKEMGILWSLKDLRPSGKSVHTRYLNWNGETAFHDDILRLAWRIPIVLGTVPYSYNYGDGEVIADYSAVHYNGVLRNAIKVYSHNTLGRETKATTWVVKGIGLVKFIGYDERQGKLTLQLIRHGNLKYP